MILWLVSMPLLVSAVTGGDEKGVIEGRKFLRHARSTPSSQDHDDVIANIHEKGNKMMDTVPVNKKPNRSDRQLPFYRYPSELHQLRRVNSSSLDDEENKDGKAIHSRRNGFNHRMHWEGSSSDSSSSSSSNRSSSSSRSSLSSSSSSSLSLDGSSSTNGSSSSSSSSRSSSSSIFPHGPSSIKGSSSSSSHDVDKLVSEWLFSSHLDGDYADMEAGVSVASAPIMINKEPEVDETNTEDEFLKQKERRRLSS